MILGHSDEPIALPNGFRIGDQLKCSLDERWYMIVDAIPDKQGIQFIMSNERGHEIIVFAECLNRWDWQGGRRGK